MGWILEFLGVILGPAVIPIILAVNSAHVSPKYMTYSAPAGSACALVSWIGTAKGMYDVVNVTTLYENWPMFVGCTVGTFTDTPTHGSLYPANQPTTGLFVPLIMYFAMWPMHRTPYDWDRLFLMQPLEPRPGDKVYTHDDNTDIGDDWDPPALESASRKAKLVSLVLVLIFLIIIPFSLYGSGYIFSRKFFTGWTVVVFIWSWVAAGVIWFLPLWQARSSWLLVLRGIFSKGKSMPKIEGEEASDGCRGQAITTEKA